MDIKLTGRQKVALIILNLEQKIVTDLIRGFSQPDIIRIAEAMEELESVKLNHESVSAVLKEYITNAGALITTVGSSSKFFHILKEALGEKEARELINELHDSPIKSFDELYNMDSAVLGAMLQVEHPQTIALIVSNMSTEKASEVLNFFSSEEQLNVIKRLLTIQETPLEIRQEIEKRMLARAATWQKGRSFVKRSTNERAKEVAEILYLIGGTQCTQVLEKLGEEDPDTAERIKDLMLVFRDLINVNQKGLQKLLSQVETKTIAIALKGVSDDVRDHILSALSTRVKQIVLDEKELLGPMPAEEVFAAQREIMKTAKNLEEKGLLAIAKGKSGAESQLVE